MILRLGLRACCVYGVEMVLENYTTSEPSSFTLRTSPAMFASLFDILILDDLLRFDRHVHNVGRLDVELALFESGFVIQHAAKEDESNVGR